MIRSNNWPLGKQFAKFDSYTVQPKNEMKKSTTLFVCTLIALFMACQPPAKQAETPTETAPTAPLTQIWASDTTLATAESVLFDKKANVLYVSCINGVPPTAQDNDGFIAKVNPADGSIIQLDWVTGIDAPKGMGISNDKLYVSNIDEVVIIDLATGSILNRVAIEGSQFLNDITVDAAGNVYVSDSNTNKIYKLTNLDVSLYMEAEFGGPNGLLVDGDKLMVAAFGSGNFYEVAADQSMKVVTDSIPGGDGVEKVGADYLVSNWNGEVYYVAANGQKELLLDTKGTANAADIEFDAESKTIYVPTFFGNQVVAYKLNK